jgi:excisionase family DNA binding protein
MSTTDPLLTAREGANLLQISVPTFWRWVANGTLPKAVKLGGMSRWPQSELLAVIELAKSKRTAT